MNMLSVSRLRHQFIVGKQVLNAVDGVSFEIAEGHTLGLVGESGCGKSTLGRAVVGLVKPTSGSVIIDGIDTTQLTGRAMLPVRRLIQMIFQDPYASLNPRSRIARILDEPLALHFAAGKVERRQRAEALALRCGLPSHLLQRFPHEFSGGQKQRIGIARALILQPKVLVCDEPVSALDVSVRAQIINLLVDLQRELKLTMLFISHDLHVVRHLSHRIAVMYLGRIVESGDRVQIFRQAQHPYTQALLASTLIPDPLGSRCMRAPIIGEPPSPLNPPSGCAFHPRCGYATDRCRVEAPILRSLDASHHTVACHHAERVPVPQTLHVCRPNVGANPWVATTQERPIHPPTRDEASNPSASPTRANSAPNASSNVHGNLGDVIDRKLDLDRLALIDLLDPQAPRQYSYREIDQLSGAVAQMLTSRPLIRGSRIAILSLNRAEYIAVYFGILRAGMVAVPINTKLAESTVSHIFKDAQVTLVFTDATSRHLVPPGTTSINFDDPGPQGFAMQTPPSDFLSVVPEAGEIAQILYTSGSTGVPKGVPLSHNGQLWAVGLRAAPGGEHERQIVAQPLFHMNGLFATTVVFGSGASLVLMPAFDVRGYTEAIARYQVSSVVAIPTMFARLIREMESRPIDLSNLKQIILASAPITATMLDRIQQAIPSAVIRVGYGTTEGGPSPFGPHPDGRTAPALALGVEIPGSEVKLVGGRNKDEGVLMMRNPSVMSGYINLPEKSACVLRDGWYYSGDFMRRDADGYFFFVGRADDMFVCSGENIYPGEVEKLLETHPAVAQAVVLAFPDEERSHIPVAFIVPHTGTALTTDELKRFSLERAPAYQYPRRIEFLSELPLAGTNKIDRSALAARARELEETRQWSSFASAASVRVDPSHGLRR